MKKIKGKSWNYLLLLRRRRERSVVFWGKKCEEKLSKSEDRRIDVSLQA